MGQPPMAQIQGAKEGWACMATHILHSAEFLDCII